MLKHLALTAALAAALVSAVRAEEVPSTTDECLKSAFELAQEAEDKKLPADQSKVVDGLLEKLEGFCDAKKFPEAAATTDEVRKAIGPKIESK